MSAKVIDKNILGADFDKVNKLAANIKQHHTAINQAQEVIDSEKKEIIEVSRKIFFNDIDDAEKIPEVVGNHEFHTEDGIVNINYRVKSPQMSDISGVPADKFLRDKVGDEPYEKLFDEVVTHTPGVTQDKMIEQSQMHPELFTIRLAELAPGQLAQLIQEHPTWIQIGIKDVKRYAEEYPDCVVKTTTVKAKAKFLDKVSKLDGVVRKKLRKFLSKFLQDTVDPVVVCGNANKTK